MSFTNYIEAVILAGGKSSRMGQDKGFVEFNGKPMLSYSIELLYQLNIPFRVVSHIEEYKYFGCEVIKDIIPGKGPMGGLYTALSHCEANRLLLLSCDTPLISEELIVHLVTASDSEKITIPVFRNKIYPLCSVYPKSILPQVKRFIKADSLKMKTLIGTLQHKMINVDRLLKGKEYILSNFNTKSDIDNFKCIETMEVRVLLFGLLAEYCQSKELFLSNVNCTDDVQKQIIARYPMLSGMKYFISVDKNIIHSNTSINSNSEVALLPPFSGG